MDRKGGQIMRTTFDHSRSGEHVSFYSAGRIVSGVIQSTTRHLALVISGQDGRPITWSIPLDQLRKV